MTSTEPATAGRVPREPGAPIRRVGMVGLGKMGLPIAANLIERGFQVIGYRRSASEELVAAGGAAALSPAATARDADVLVSILPDLAALEDVVCGERGTLATMRPGTVHIEMSTLDITGKERIRAMVADAGGDLLDCPISGSPGMVAPRLATTFVSGDTGSVDVVRPVLDAISGPWVYTGAFGTGARMKYIAQMLMAVHTVAAGEAMLMARRSGLDLELVQQTLDNSIAASAIWKQRGPVMRERRWLPAPGPIDTLYAILEQVVECIDSTQVDAPVFGAAKAVFDRAVEHGWGHLDIAAVYDELSGQDALNREGSS